jgi:putative hydrolase
MIINFLPVDLHTHTNASTHAFSTLYENVKAAKAKGLQMIANTDHGPKMPDAPHLYHFFNQKVLPHVIDGVIVLRGIEANFLKTKKTDCSANLYAALDIVLGGCHQVSLENTTFEDNTDIIIHAIKQHYIDVLTHLGDVAFPKDHEAIIKVAAEHNVAIELNAASGVYSRIGSDANCLKVARLCKKYKALVTINSDAHFCSHIGNLEHAINIANEANLPTSCILNTSTTKVLQFLKDRGHKISDEVIEYAQSLPEINCNKY